MAGSPQGRFQDLETLARERFGGLSNAELALLRAAPKGELAACGPPAPEDPANDPAKADTWGPERQIRAGVIRWLCVDSEAARRVDPKGIQVHGAKVVGRLDLCFADVPFPVGLFRCRLTADADLKYARIPALYLNGTWTRSITADGISVPGGVFFRDGFSAEGEVRLLGAQIGGQLNCTGGTFKNPEGNALHADGANVKGGVFLNEKFNAEGELRLLGAQIGGDLTCSGGTFKNPGKDALSADGVSVQGSVFLDEKFSAEGEVRLLGAQIGNQLNCAGGTFKNPGSDALSADGVNVKGDVVLCEDLSADGANVQGSVFPNKGFSAEGEVRLLGAQIGGALACRGGTFKNPGKDALSADRVNVRGSVFLNKGFSAEGAVRLLGAQIGSNLDCSGGRFTEVIAETAVINGNFFWRRIPDAQKVQLNLINVSARTIVDEEASWPAAGNLKLDGFIYGRISADPTDAQKRLQWLAHVNRFTLQPYRQLATVLREMGDTEGARQVLFEMEHRRRKLEDQSWRARRGSWLLRETIGYGFYPRWAIWWIVFLTLCGFLLFGLAYVGGTMTPTDKDAYAFFEKHGAPPSYYQAFNPLIYSLENSVPLVNLGQKEIWTPNPNSQSPGRTPVIPSGFLAKLENGQVFDFRLHCLEHLWLLRWFRWGQVLAGWLLTTLFVYGLAEVMRAEK